MSTPNRNSDANSDRTLDSSPISDGVSPQRSAKKIQGILAARTPRFIYMTDLIE
ncbi:MAG TPA: hypothetical protein V6D11_18555 [Waterburya sp.]